MCILVHGGTVIIQVTLTNTKLNAGEIHIGLRIFANFGSSKSFLEKRPSGSAPSHLDLTRDDIIDFRASSFIAHMSCDAFTRIYSANQRTNQLRIEKVTGEQYTLSTMSY